MLEGFAGQLGDTLRAASASGRKLYGFAEHELTSTFLGTSAGLRLRHDQPSGKVELNAKSADLSRSAWAGEATRDFTDVDVAALDGGLAERLEWARRRVELPAGRYETLLPPTATADLLTYLYWSAGAKDALDGRTVFSKPGGGTRVGESLTGLPVTLRSDPRYPGPGVRPVRRGARLRPGLVGVRQRAAARADGMDPARRAGRADPDPVFGPAVRAARSPPPSTT